MKPQRYIITVFNYRYASQNIDHTTQPILARKEYVRRHYAMKFYETQANRQGVAVRLEAPDFYHCRWSAGGYEYTGSYQYINISQD